MAKSRSHRTYRGTKKLALVPPGALRFETFESRLMLSVTPSVSITSPSIGTVYQPGSSVTVTATASEVGGTINTVQFYASGASLGFGTLSNGIYSVTWPKPANSSYNLTAVATDASNVKGTSPGVGIRIDNPPKVNITAPSNVVFQPGFSTTITATASDTDGTVASVQFFDNGSSLGQGTLNGGVWSIPWANATPATHTLTAVATDNDGAKTTGSPDNIRVNILPSTSLLSPGNNSVYASGSNITISAKAADNDGSVQSLQFFANGAAIGSGTLTSGNSTSGTYSYTWTAPPAGVYSITSVATDNNGGVTTSSPITVTEKGGVTVALVNPAPGGSVAVNRSSIILSAQASEIGGTISALSFYADGSLLGRGTLANGYYTYNWTTAAIGTHTIQATATDSTNNTASSSASLRVDAPPSVALTSPAAGSTNLAQQPVPLAATASDSDGTVTNVEFYVDGNDVGAGVINNGVYTYSWSPTSGGSHQLTAVATDNDGATTTSAAVAFNVNSRPVVSVTVPMSGAVFAPNQSINLVASASAASGSVTGVEFYADNTDLGAGVLINGLYTYTWAGASIGTHQITALVSDSNGATATSSATSIRVNNPPTVTLNSPTDGTVFLSGQVIPLAAQAGDTDGTITGVEFYSDSTDIGPGVLSNGVYLLNWNTASSGTHTLTATATDSDGATTSSNSVGVTVDPGPSIGITSPSGQVVAQGSTVPLAATASETGGTISNVEFYADGTDLGSGVLSNGLYTYAWNATTGGLHQITAVATDNNGAIANAPAASVTVDPPPTASISAAPSSLQFQQGNPATFTATASDQFGTISGVQFYSDNLLLGAGTLANGVYSYTWTNAVAGTHAVTAVATDNLGSTTTSSPLSVQVIPAPTVVVTSPLSGALLQGGTTIPLTATAIDPANPIQSVEFYADGNDLGAGVLNNGSYVYNWVNAAPGTHQVMAVATNATGGLESSTSVTFRINALPLVSMVSPANGGVFQPSTTIPLTALASDSDGTIANVEFYADGADLGAGTLSNGVYLFNWAGAAIGSHQIKAAATDNDGGVSTTSNLTIRVNNPPSLTLSLTNSNTQNVYAPGAALAFSVSAADTDGTVNNVEIFADGADVGPATFTAGTTANGTWTYSYGSSILGAHSLTAVATDNDGATTTSKSVPITIDIAPTVSITSPSAGASFTTNTLSLGATAASQLGSITSVQFFDNGTAIGAATLNGGIYTYNWVNAPSGTQVLTAVATDQIGVSTTSAPVSIFISTVAQIAASTSLNTTVGHPVEVQALNSGLGYGTPLTTEYKWDFGDTNPGSQFDKLIGFNAGHEYDTPGTYTITLSVEDSSGYTSTTTATVNVLPSTPTKILYVAANGSDSNSGLSPSAPLHSFAAALSQTTSNTTVLFNDGDTFGVEASISLNNVSNVIFGTYGSGTAPTLLWDGARIATSGFFQIAPTCSNITVTGFTFDSIFTSDTEETNMPFSVRTGGTNIAVIGNTFLNVAEGVDGSLRPTGLLVENNTAPLVTGLRAYFTWAEGSDITIIGNYAANSTREHIVRVAGGGGTRVLVEYNNFTNLDRTGQGDPSDIAKGTVTAQIGSYLYVSHNTLNTGPTGVGPLNRADLINDPTQQAAHFTWAVFEDNTLNCQMLLQPGASNIMIRNNISNRPNASTFTINGYDSNYHREVVNATYVGNTVINTGTSGQFLNTTGPASQISLIDNLYVAPGLVMGINGAAPVVVEESNLASFSVISHNVWPTGNPNPHANGGVNYVDSFYFENAGYVTPAAWNKMAGVDTDMFANVTVDAMDSPMANPALIGAAVAVAGWFDDFYGTLRSYSALVPGAVQTSSSTVFTGGTITGGSISGGLVITSKGTTAGNNGALLKSGSTTTTKVTPAQINPTTKVAFTPLKTNVVKS